MTGKKYYYKIPIISKLFKTKFYISWRDEKFYSLGFQKDMTFQDALRRLEAKRIRQEFYKNGSIF